MSEGLFGAKLPEDVNELYFEIVGIIRDIERYICYLG